MLRHCKNINISQVISEPVSDLIEVSVQKAAGKIRSLFHQLEEAHKVVAADGSKCLNGKLHLRGVAHLITKLLHLTRWRFKKKSHLSVMRYNNHKRQQTVEEKNIYQ